MIIKRCCVPMKSTSHFYLVPRLRMSPVRLPLACAPSWHAQNCLRHTAVVRPDWIYRRIVLRRLLFGLLTVYRWLERFAELYVSYKVMGWKLTWVIPSSSRALSLAGWGNGERWWKREAQGTRLVLVFCHEMSVKDLFSSHNMVRVIKWRVCSAYGGEAYTGFWWGNLGERDN